MTAASASTCFRASSALSAAVLAGGASRRMGDDKAMLSLAPGSPPVIIRVLEAVSRVADDVLIIAPDRPGYRSLGVPIVPDRRAALGPIAGIATALEVARHDHCLVVACDLPFLDPALLSWMASLPRDYEALIPLAPRGAGTPLLQPLHAIYARAGLPTILARIALGDLRLTNLERHLRVRSIETDKLREIDPELRSFLNLNTPADARRAAAILALHPVSNPIHERSESEESVCIRPVATSPGDATAPTERPKNG